MALFARRYADAGPDLFIPDVGVTSVFVTMIAGGGGGGSGRVGLFNAGGGGGSGESCFNVPYIVVPGVPIALVVGFAGPGGIGAGTTDGHPGGDSTFGSIIMRAGGGGFSGNDPTHPGWQHGGYGGGPLGATENVTGTGIAGTFNSRVMGGGSGGAGTSRGAPCGPYLGGSTGTNLAPGNGGASSPWGQGGQGADGAPAVQPVPNAPAAPLASYGCGGGGGSGGTGLPPGYQSFGAYGVAGIVIVQWIKLNGTP